MDDVVPVVVGNALTGVGVVPNTVAFLNGLGLGLKASSLGAVSAKILGGVLVVAGVVGVMDGKATFGSTPPTGLFVPKPNRV